MAEPIDRLYWEEWARSLGWEAQKINEAGSLGSHAIAEGMSTAQAMDVVLAVVRDGQATPVRLSSVDRIVRLKGMASVAAGGGGPRAFPFRPRPHPPPTPLYNSACRAPRPRNI